MSNYSGQIINALLSSEKNQIHIVAGFDAAIDSLVKPVRNRNADGTKEYFKTIADFGEFLTEKHNLSCMIEVDTVMEKSGGNMVNFSHAIGELGGLVDCIGSLGVTKTHPMFEHLSTNCTLHGAADPGECMALEFSDGKVMLSRMDKANELSMENVQKKRPHQKDGSC